MEPITRGIAIGRQKLDRSQIIEKRAADPEEKQRRKTLTDSAAAHME